jgi:hypothetical protein
MQYSSTLLTLTVGMRLAFASSGTQIEKSFMLQSISPAPASAQASEAAAWEELDRNAMTSERLDAVAEYLRSTGQASA